MKLILGLMDIPHCWMQNLPGGGDKWNPPTQLCLGEHQQTLSWPSSSPQAHESTSLVSGQVVNGDDSASSDDDDGGSVEPDREEDAESLLCELDSDDNGLEYD